MNRRNLFAMTDRQSIMATEDCGMVNGRLALYGWLDEVAEIRWLYAMPYYSADFRMTVRFDAMRVRTGGYRWSPECLTRRGTLPGLRIVSDLIPMKNERAAIMRITVKNTSDKPRIVPLQYEFFGGVNRQAHWRFGHYKECCYAEKRWEDGVLIAANDKGEIRMASSLKLAPALPVRTGVLNAPDVKIAPGKSLVFHTVLTIGTPEDNQRVIAAARRDYERCCREALAHWKQRVEHLFSQVPDLESDNRELVDYYHRSLIHLLMNEWNGKDFFLDPYYATGCIHGDTVNCYMWNYGGPYRMWSLLDPASAKAYIRHFLSLDLTSCYAFYADDGGGNGPYYPINQEKVIFLAYYYVMQTGDVSMLTEDLNGQPVIARLVREALVLDDLSVRAKLADYGDSNDHLELRSPTFAADPMMRYDGIVPDLNLRRCSNFHLVNDLCKLSGYDPGIDLGGRAEALKELIHRELFSPEHGWFRCIGHKGHEIYRYTIQMFKNLGWGDRVLTPEAEAALVGHLMNEAEFLGPYGVHSLSKTDPAYYEDDVDNGGPGACVSFAPAIIDRLYRSGRVREAENILRRLLWMGGCLPYWGDSQRADVRDYRRNTSLQCDIEGAVPAQTIIFGMFGIDIRPDFSIRITPHRFPETQWMKLTNVRLAEMTFDILCDRAGVRVECGGKTYAAGPGGTVTLPSRIGK